MGPDGGIEVPRGGSVVFMRYFNKNLKSEKKEDEEWRMGVLVLISMTSEM